MTTSEDMRNKAQKVRDDAEVIRRENLKKHEEKIAEIAESLVEELLPETLRAIEVASGRGNKSCVIEYYEYSGSEYRARVLAYEKVMLKLQEPPHQFQVWKSSREGYNGEGSNMSDFYTVHSWEIS